MRTLLFFDLPSVSLEEKRHYRKFVKAIKGLGFIMLQESVYYMLSINQQNVDARLALVKEKLPPKGNIMVLTVTEKQFASMKILLGNNETDVIASDDRTVIF